MPPYDALILGGGPSGLATALALCQTRHTALVFDSGCYRNGASTRLYGVPTWEHCDPAAYRAAARRDLDHTNMVEFADDTTVQSVLVVGTARTGKNGGGGGLFRVTDTRGQEWEGRKLVLAMGVVDLMPEIPGFEACWPHLIHRGLFCHGFESQIPGQKHDSAAVLAINDCATVVLAYLYARRARQLAHSVSIYTHGNETLARETAPYTSDLDGITIDARPIQHLLVNEAPTRGVLVEFAHGSSATHTFLAYKPATVPKSMELVKDLSLALSEGGSEIATSGVSLETSVRGCFAVGDCGTSAKSITGAVASGAAAALGVSGQLLCE